MDTQPTLTERQIHLINGWLNPKYGEDSFTQKELQEIQEALRLYL